MDTKSVVQRVQQLKERLSHAQDPKKISKALRSLQELDISLEILVETGIGKTVNSFRKHYDVGDVARSIVLQWKKLVPEIKEPQVDQKLEKHDKKITEDKKVAHSMSREKNEGVSKASNQTKSSKSEESSTQKKTHQHKAKSEKTIKVEGKPPDKSKSHSSSKDKDSRNLDGEKKRSEKHSSSTPMEKEKKPSPKEEGKQCDKNSQNQKSKVLDNHFKQSLEKNKDGKNSDEDDSGVPTMSFESYLNYDQVSNKRKKKQCSSSEPPRKIQICKQYCNVQLSVVETPPASANPVSIEVKLETDDAPVKELKTNSLADLLNLPLPKVLPDYSVLSSPPHTADNKPYVPDALANTGCESNGFTGRRLNTKMLVYSGSKTIYLPKMLTLYEQCIRVLQNNVDSIQEVGGVPFEILMPVLERCTPEQLSRIEECNSAFIEDSGDLWKKHCERDFRGQKLLEYESWREMYIRLFTEREEKLRMITQNISSAHSGKPKGRQVKLAYIHGVAKPPHYIRRKQEIHGTAGLILPPHPPDKYKLQKFEHRDKSIPPTNQSTSTNSGLPINNGHSSGPSQDPKKTVKRIAPMMAKTMRAFRNRVGPR
ncbi:elongin-A-like [Spea bombifrons]|uniref:elongin-A-like n=1 Tax=Spea bombifrons TaxID=233779 RepID=UPI00234BF1BC|nr:elongin-A-like [Spea bombifrons]